MLIKKFPQLLFCSIYSISLPTYWKTLGHKFQSEISNITNFALDQRLIKIAKLERKSATATVIKTYS